jgi:PAS domain S-box-containing protein
VGTLAEPADPDPKRADQELQRLAAIVECSDDAIISKDLNGAITSWNRAAERLFGYRAEEVIGRPISLLMPAERHDDMDAILGRIRRGERIDHYETYRVTKGGRTIPVSLSVSPIRDGSGRIVGAAKIARDISDRRAAEAERERLLREAREAVEARDIFLSVAGHELRTPLNALNLQLYSLRTLLTKPAQRAALTRLEKAVERLSELTHRLVDVARMAPESLSLERRVMDLSELVSEVAGRMETDASHAGCSFELRADGPAVGCWDRSRLDQVVTNLFTNALKFGRGAPVEVTVEGESRVVRLRVRDYGIGVPPADRQRIFGRFERGVSDQSYGGLGLGLWIARQIVAVHGGRIDVADTSGRGAEFVVELDRGM